MTNLERYLAETLNKNQLNLTDVAQQKLLQYLELLQKWNRVFNLTSITDPKESVYLHLIDSLVIGPCLEKKLSTSFMNARCLDVGSGAGLPGIPLAIAYPEQQWVLLDKNSKKTRFMMQAVAELELKNVEVIHAGVDQYHPAQLFDLIFSRAFGTLSLFTTLTHHLIATNGLWAAMKGQYPQEEIDELAHSNPDIVLNESISLSIKGLDAKRHLITLMKGR